MRLIALLLIPGFLIADSRDYYTRTTLGSTNWTQSTASSFTVDGEIRGAGTNNQRQTAVFVLDGTPANDSCAEVILRDSDWASKPSGQSVGVFIRGTTAGSGYAGWLFTAGSSQFFLRIEELTSLSPQTLKQGANSATVPQQNDRLRICGSGTTITVSLLQGQAGSTPRIASEQGTDATFTSGYCGIAKSTLNIRVDDFHCWSTMEPARTKTGTDLYVAVNGVAGAVGTEAAPTTMDWLMAKSGSLAPGTTVWLRGGAYEDDPSRFFFPQGSHEGIFKLTGAGTSGNPVTIRGYPGEIAKVDPDLVAATIGDVYNNIPTILIEGQDLVLRDIHITNSNLSRCCLGGPHRPYGVKIAGTRISVINNWIYDAGQAVTANTASAIDYVIRGNLLINNGDNGANGVFGHAMYLEHNGTRATVEGNIVGRHFNSAANDGGQIQVFSQGGNPAQNITFAANTIFQIRWITFWTSDLSDDWIEDNRLYNNLAGFRFAEDVASGCQTGIKFNGNHVHDKAFVWRFTAGAEFSNNVFATREASIRWTYDRISTQAACDTYAELFGTMDGNTYYETQAGGADWTKLTDKSGPSATNVDFTTWKSDTGKDAASTRITSTYPAISQASQGVSATDYVYTWLSPDEAGRAHITVYGYKGLTAIAYDPSSVLTSGDSFKLIDAQCYLCAPVLSGTWTSGTFNLPMNLTAVTEPIGNYTVDPQTCPGADPGDPGTPLPTVTHTSSEFAVFILMKQAAEADSLIKGNTVTGGNVNIN